MPGLDNNKQIFYFILSFLILLLGALLLYKPEEGVILFAGFIFVFVFLISIAYSFKAGMILLLLSIPLSIDLVFDNINLKVSFPSEVFLATIGILFLLQLLFYLKTDVKFLKHPISIIIYLYIIFTIFTLFFSSIFMVSFKTTVARIAFITVFYFLIGHFLRKDFNFSIKFFWLYGVSIAIVALYVIIKFSTYDFSIRLSNYMPAPFYNDHTIYSACIAMMIPFFLAYTFFVNRTKEGINTLQLFSFLILIILLAGFYFSYSRAGWLSLFLSISFGLLIVAGLRFYHVVLLTIAGILILIFNFEYILIETERTTAASTAGMQIELEDQVRSITNIRTDVSNTERINRWKSSWRMFNAKPFTGFGPGTYQFEYLTFQNPAEMTVISVRTPDQHQLGRGGSAHSEYFLILSESGAPGFIVWIMLIIFILYYGMKNFITSANINDKILAWSAITGILTFFIHAFFNNFLDVEKAAALFWGICAVITALDCKNTDL